MTPQERDAFIAWLESRARDNDGIIRQLEALHSGPMDALARKYQTETAACRVVSALLQRIDFDSISSEEDR